MSGSRVVLTVRSPDAGAPYSIEIDPRSEIVFAAAGRYPLAARELVLSAGDVVRYLLRVRQAAPPVVRTRSIGPGAHLRKADSKDESNANRESESGCRSGRGPGSSQAPSWKQVSEGIALPVGEDVAPVTAPVQVGPGAFLRKGSTRGDRPSTESESGTRTAASGLRGSR